MNANVRIRPTGRVFRFGGVQRVWSDGGSLSIYADMGDVVTISPKRTNKLSVGVDEVTRFRLRDVAEVALDDEPNPHRFRAIA